MHIWLLLAPPLSATAAAAAAVCVCVMCVTTASVANFQQHLPKLIILRKFYVDRLSLPHIEGVPTEGLRQFDPKFMRRTRSEIFKDGMRSMYVHHYFVGTLSFCLDDGPNHCSSYFYFASPTTVDYRKT